MKHALLNKPLTLDYITRQTIEDASLTTFCDNCGKVIINIAHVHDEHGVHYHIGLDCKKTLIDKPILAETPKNESRDVKYLLNLPEKVLKLLDDPDIELSEDCVFGEVNFRRTSVRNKIKSGELTPWSPEASRSLALTVKSIDLIRAGLKTVVIEAVKLRRLEQGIKRA